MTPLPCPFCGAVPCVHWEDTFSVVQCDGTTCAGLPGQRMALRDVVIDPLPRLALGLRLGQYPGEGAAVALGVVGAPHCRPFSRSSLALLPALDPK